MGDIKLGYVNTEEMGKTTHQGLKYKLLRCIATGLVIVSLVPMLTGCGKTTQNDVTYDPQIGYVYFDEEARSKDYISIGSEMTNTGLEELAEFGENVREVYIDYGFNIDDLSALVRYCPNIEIIHISYAPSISDLSFIYSLPNLKKVDLKENGFVTPELVEYLDRCGIEHNITNKDLEHAAELDKIIDEIITEDMTDEEKIQAITYYVINNYHYKITKVGESNDRPLSSTLENGGGVCASYAYLTNVLLRKAGINSYEVVTENKLLGHAWNLVEVDGKYYYLDATNIKQIPFISKLVLKYFNVGFFYMTDPKATGLSPMVDFDKVEKISIPPEMIEDIERGESEKNIFEKYGNSVPARIIEIVLAITAVTVGISLTTKGIEAVSDSISYRKYKKEEQKRKAREALRRKREAEARRNAARRGGRGYY